VHADVVCPERPRPVVNDTLSGVHPVALSPFFFFFSQTVSFNTFFPSLLIPYSCCVVLHAPVCQFRPSLMPRSRFTPVLLKPTHNVFSPLLLLPFPPPTECEICLSAIHASASFLCAWRIGRHGTPFLFGFSDDDADLPVSLLCFPSRHWRGLPSPLFGFSPLCTTSDFPPLSIFPQFLSLFLFLCKRLVVRF